MSARETEQPDAGQETVAALGEFATITDVTAGRRQPAQTVLGPGDDAAVVAAPDGRVVASTDMLVAGVHFRTDWSSPEQIGRKAVAVNLADVAAMGAVPTSILVGLACPGETPSATVGSLANGMWAEAARAGIGIAGGDLARSDELTISITALGDLEGRAPVTRSGARPGDILAINGQLGWAAAGLAVLGRGFRSPIGVVNAQRCPEPDYAAGVAAALAGATAMIDISDGLLADLEHIAGSSGVGLDVYSSALHVDQKLVDVSSALGTDPLRWVLTGGEDHALVATFPPYTDLPAGWRQVGLVQLPDGGVTVDGDTCTGELGWQHWR